MATRSLFKSNLTSQFLRKPFHLSAPIAQSKILDEALRLPLTQISELPLPAPACRLSDFLGANQKHHIGEGGFPSTRQCLQTEDSALGGYLWAQARRGSSSSRKQIDSEEELDYDDLDDSDHYGDLINDMYDDKDFDGVDGKDFDDDDDEEEEEEIDDKPRRRK